MNLNKLNLQPPLSFPSKQAIEAYEENEAREFVSDRAELAQKEALIQQMMASLKK